jgi:hypothetical protein
VLSLEYFFFSLKFNISAWTLFFYIIKKKISPDNNKASAHSKVSGLLLKKIHFTKDKKSTRLDTIIVLTWKSSTFHYLTGDMYGCTFVFMVGNTIQQFEYKDR